MRYMSKKEFDLKMRRIKYRNEQLELRNKLKAERNKIRQSRISKMNTSTKILISAIIAVISYTVASLYIQYHTGVEVSSTLTTLWFSFWTVEIVVLAGIKVSKVIKNYSYVASDAETTENNEPSESYERNEL